MNAEHFVTTREVTIAQLLAARVMAEATITQLDATLAVLGVPMQDDEIANDCTHPIEQRDNLTEMGGPLEWRCRACGFHSTTSDED